MKRVGVGLTPEKVETRVTPNFLTLRRRQLLEHMAAGDSYEQTARALGIKEQTVRNEMHRLMRRMGSRNRAHAVAIAVGQGWITLKQGKGEVLG